jgi:ubiquitin carboxyl-terminal hydrolase 36/42
VKKESKEQIMSINHTPSTSASYDAKQKEFRPLLKRDVARPVANLGNTCYMNAVLQALAHAPELCMAMDVEPHHASCPIYLENAQKRRASPSSSPDTEDYANKPTGTRKSRRSGGKKSPTNHIEGDFRFCALCEVEQHFFRVHSETNNRDKPVAPSAFVNGFIDRVAPWFKLGQQEDSHEFLRLLIDAMQKSCKQARSAQENPQDTPPPEETTEEKESDDVEYPFELFRGTVESNVTCGFCHSSSSTMDPIEDIGLDVTPPASSSISPPPGYLADVGSALQRFARAEVLDSGYKCEKCGKVGRATKQSRLASIPPILTLHLKRFRYGADAQKNTFPSTGQGSRRSGRSELSQLLGSNSGDYFTGKSGAAKIEGRSKFEQILDLRPYLTEKLQNENRTIMCRLFAVIVHAGKNSHSGHYIAYVRNITKNEWWKMDDARVTTASLAEVMNAEAYMLFYRVVEHPVSSLLREKAKKLQKDFIEQQQQKQESQAKAAVNAGLASKVEEVRMVNLTKEINVKAEMNVPVSAPSNSKPIKNNNHRKRKAPEFTCAEDWANSRTSLPRQMIEKLRVSTLSFSTPSSEILSNFSICIAC